MECMYGTSIKEAASARTINAVHADSCTRLSESNNLFSNPNSTGSKKLVALCSRTNQLENLLTAQQAMERTNG